MRSSAVGAEHQVELKFVVEDCNRFEGYARLVGCPSRVKHEVLRLPPPTQFLQLERKHSRLVDLDVPNLLEFATATCAHVHEHLCVRHLFRLVASK